MVTLHVQIVKKSGKKDYVVLPYDEFLKVQEELKDYDDLRFLREAKETERDTPTVGIAELKRRLEGEQVATADAVRTARLSAIVGPPNLAWSAI